MKNILDGGNRIVYNLCTNGRQRRLPRIQVGSVFLVGAFFDPQKEEEGKCCAKDK